MVIFHSYVKFPEGITWYNDLTAFLPQERTFDPVLGRYRDGQVESTQRHAEERERVAHLNRAKDIQILREQPFNILSQDWLFTGDSYVLSV